ncbi:hypothetical protein LOZ54_005162 [Ophidiomyces ophidiicola]|nr:hypothetical protein LOZ54_005162 [Ophidiomyces ophidiicola]
MAAGPHTFVDIAPPPPTSHPQRVSTLTASFSDTHCRYRGLQLAIVSVRGDALSYQQKQQIAREFNHPTTAFLRDAPHYSSRPRKLELFSPGAERNFAAGAVLGTAQYIFQNLMNEDDAASAALPNPSIPTGHTPGAKLSKCALETKAGVIQAHFDPARRIAAIDVPVDVHVHAKETPRDEILAVQRSLRASPLVDRMKVSYAVVSIYRGLAFTLVDFTTCPTLISLLQPGETPEPSLDIGWKSAPASGASTPTTTITMTTTTTTTKTSPAPVVECYGAVYFIQLQTDFTEEPYITRLVVRVIAGGVEEAAGASGCCALAAYLALQKGGASSRHAFAIEQGIEMGRKSQLCIDLRLNEQGTGVVKIMLSGKMTLAMEGRLLL